jgi:hypothetical protein
MTDRGVHRFRAALIALGIIIAAGNAGAIASSVEDGVSAAAAPDNDQRPDQKSGDIPVRVIAPSIPGERRCTLLNGESIPWSFPNVPFAALSCG